MGKGKGGEDGVNRGGDKEGNRVVKKVRKLFTRKNGQGK
jgi:hypothetical protein